MGAPEKPPPQETKAKAFTSTGLNALNLPRPSGKFYKKSQAVKIVAARSARGSRDLRLSIQEIATRGHVPSKSALYDAVSKYERGETVIDGWGKQAGLQSKPKMFTQWAYSAVRYSDRKTWKGELKLPLTLANFTDVDSRGGTLTGTSGAGHWYEGFIGPGAYDLNKPEMEKVELWIGCQVPDSMSDLIRMYFSPTEFPPPASVADGGKGETYLALKAYIRRQASLANTPVVCTGSSKGKPEKIFRCQKHGKVIGGQRVYCPYTFTLRWDKIGYYIHLKESGLLTCGCPFHSCPPPNTVRRMQKGSGRRVKATKRMSDLR